MPKNHSQITLETAPTGAVRIIGSLRGGGRKTLLAELTKLANQSSGQRVKIDLSGVESIDSLGASLLAEVVVQSRMRGREVELVNANESVEKGLRQHYYPAPEIRMPAMKTRPLVRLGEKMYELTASAGELLVLMSESFYWTLIGVVSAQGRRKGSAAAQALTIGVGALPVVMLIAFLIGIVLVLQSASQLRQFGANIFVANLVCIAMAREMGPLMTAILLAGRSGAAIAAEISTMTVNEETDALRTMAINPIRYIVVPKLLAMTLTAPLLTIVSVIIGILGGFAVATGSLDLTPQSFILQSVNSLFLKDILTGLAKSLVFAWLIVILAAYFGFRVTGGPEGVGLATTRAVVASIFAVIVADSGLGLLFYL